MRTYENAAYGLRYMIIARLGAVICFLFTTLPSFEVVGGVGAIVFLMVSLVALRHMGKDIEGCKPAFMLTIIQLLVSTISALFGSEFYEVVYIGLKIADDLIALLIVRAVCLSVTSLTDTLNSPKTAKMGRNAWKLNLAYYMAAIIFNVLLLTPLLGFVVAVTVSYMLVIFFLAVTMEYIAFLMHSCKVICHTRPHI